MLSWSYLFCRKENQVYIFLENDLAPDPNCFVSKVENWTKKQRNAAKQKWSLDKAKWSACNQDTNGQRLSGRKSWWYLYNCMSKA
jgi:hypothetical protein